MRSERDMIGTFHFILLLFMRQKITAELLACDAVHQRARKACIKTFVARQRLYASRRARSVAIE
jgi:hypothetical protein